jgi:HEAT repeat protein
MFAKTTTLLLAAVAALSAQPDKTAWDVLKLSLSDKNPDKRRQAVTSIGSIGVTPDAVRLVEQALKDADSLVRQTAAAELGEIKSRGSIAILKTELDDPAVEVAFAAAAALWEMGDRSGRGLIEDVMTGQETAAEGFMSREMREAKRKIHDPKALAVLGLKEASGVLLGPFNLGIVAAEQAFKDGATAGRTLSTALLAEDCDAEAIRLLEWTYGNDKHWVVKAAAAKALGKCGNADSIPRLEQGLADSQEAVKDMSAASIVRISMKSEGKQAGAE